MNGTSLQVLRRLETGPRTPSALRRCLRGLRDPFTTVLLAARKPPRVRRVPAAAVARRPGRVGRAAFLAAVGLAVRRSRLGAALGMTALPAP
ncbi:hypothetical protein ABT187_02645 [Streptomyces sp. NPDC001817]|uniref:hypothetical protein n=1 Tax=Streptomyces sp. NPDC001817 TaxID=3154398 RepID=UPI00332F72C5